MSQVAIVVGGGNFFRGAHWAGASGLDRAAADQIGYDIIFHFVRVDLEKYVNEVNAPRQKQLYFSPLYCEASVCVGTPLNVKSNLL